MTTLQVYNLIFALTIVSAVSALVTSFLYPRFQILSLIQLLLLTSVAADFINTLNIIFWQSGINRYVGLCYRFLELFILLQFYFHLFQKNKSGQFVKILIFVLPIAFLFNIYFEWFSFRTINMLVFSILSIMYFYKIIKEMKMDSPVNNPVFWVNSAILIYFSGSLFFLIFYEPLKNLHTQGAVISFALHNTLGITKNILFIKAFTLTRKNPSFVTSI